ncbi:hypothetical protein V1478_001355 [Vespula squamosa]|uniref:Uncharacterized protein n=1 Tax=Vespula squamosa TaxID=30214 RepID=A0ABD2C176_VESSQ
MLVLRLGSSSKIFFLFIIGLNRFRRICDKRTESIELSSGVTRRLLEEEEKEEFKIVDSVRKTRTDRVRDQIRRPIRPSRRKFLEERERSFSKT